MIKSEHNNQSFILYYRHQQMYWGGADLYETFNLVATHNIT